MQCQCGQATGVACEFDGPADELVTVEFMPPYLRASHRAAGDWGSYPANGAWRLRVTPECADMLDDDDDEDEDEGLVA